MHVLGTGVPRCLGVARSASSPKAAQALGCSLTPGLRISFGRVTCMARAASVLGPWTLGFILLRGACVWVWVVVGFGFRLRPATLCSGVCVCVRLCVRSASTLPIPAGVCGVGVCGWARVPAAPRHSWLGCRGLRLLVCALRLHPATPGWGVRRGCVCFGSGFGCASSLLAGVLGCVCACVRAPLVPSPSWLGRAAWLCVLGLGFRLRPAIPGWGVGVRLYLSARSTCTPPLLAGVCGAGAGALAWVAAAPRHSWPGCWAVCMFVCAFRLHSATLGRGGGLCVCWCAFFACTPPLLAGVLVSSPGEQPVVVGYAAFSAISCVCVSSSARVGVPPFLCAGAGGWWARPGAVCAVPGARCGGASLQACASAAVRLEPWCGRDPQRSRSVDWVWWCWAFRCGVLLFPGVRPGAHCCALSPSAIAPGLTSSPCWWSSGGSLPPYCVAPGALSLWAPACYLGPLLPLSPRAFPLSFPFPLCWWWGGGEDSGAPMAHARAGWSGATGRGFRGFKGGGGPGPRPAGEFSMPRAACGPPGRSRWGWRGCG